MAEINDVYIIAGCRTAIGDFGGTLKDVPPAELGSIVLRDAVRRAKVDANDVQHVVLGQVIPSEPKDAYISRVAAINAGLPQECPAVTINRLCGTGLQAIISAAQLVQLGEVKIAVGGGTETMSSSPHVLQGSRWGTKMGSLTAIDAMVATLSDPFEGCHMGVTGENVAERYEVTREAQDELAVLSHRRAAQAIAEGRFKEQIVPVEIKTRKGVTVFDTDEHVRHGINIEDMAGLKPVFKKDGTITPANASAINDGAAAVVLASAEAVEQRGLTPFAKIIGWGYAGVDPQVMGIGPVRAVPLALERAGITLDDVDVIEANEAFAAQACAVASQLGFDPDKLNPNGSGIALGHPIGATGAILTVKTIYELQRTGGRYGLITMCIGGGQGIAAVVERV